MTTVATRKVAEPAVIRINQEIDRALSCAAKDFKMTRARIVKNALMDYLEDLADSKAIAEAKKQGGAMITHAELKARLGL